MKRPLVVIATAVALLGSVIHADAGPSSDRTRLSDQAGVFADTPQDVAAEINFGRNVAARILARYPLHGDEALNHYINLVGNTLTLSSARPELTFRFAVLETDAVNAYAAPGGYIFVTRGALNAMSDEAELAAVLAHEIAHVTEKHIVNAMNISGESGGTGIGSIFSSISDPLRAAFTVAVDKAMSILFQEGLDQQDEFEADRYALELLAVTGYDPRALERYLEKLGSRHDMPQTITDTHPGFDTRLASLRAATGEMGLEKAGQARLTERFTSYVHK